MSKDIIFQSTYDNIVEFIKDKGLITVMSLYQYISTTEMLKRPPTEFEKNFIGDFFTHEGWADYVQERKRRQTHPDSGIMFYKPSFDIDTILSILSYEIIIKSKIAIKLLTNKLKKVEKLKIQLETDLDNGVLDGVFSKVEGFSNIYKTLILYDMLKERED